MRGFVCYLERSAAGAAIRRARIVGPEVDHTWTAPEESGAPAPVGGEPGAGAALGSLRSAARWVADELDGVRELLAVCVDTDGGLCSWLSAPSSDPSVVAAALRQAPGMGMSGDDGGAGGDGAGVGVLAGAGFGSDRSVQALAAGAVPASRSTSLLALARKSSAQQAPAKRQRLAVLSVPDAPVRVFLDELDRLKIEVGSVVSLWHAAAAAWAPGERGHPAPGANGHAERFAASTSPVTGVVLIDPLGRLVWAWSSEGELVAAGSMRLRTAAPPALDVPAPLQPLGETGSELALSDTGVRRVPQEVSTERPALECGTSEVGRLVVDWLAWSAQLGQSPERIICVGPQTVPGDGARAGAVAPASLAEAVTLAWPGATVDLVVHEDPVGATLNRLRGGPGSPAAPIGKGAAKGASGELPADPRVELVELSRRPGRVDRRLYLWGALAILAAGAATAVLGWRIERAAGTARDQADEVMGKRAEILKEVEGVPGVMAGIAQRQDPLGELMGTLTKMREQRSKLQPERPVVQEVVRVLEAMQPLGAIQIGEINISSTIGGVKITVPKDDGLTGPTLLNKLEASNSENQEVLKKLSVPVVMQWRGDFRNIRGDRRDYWLSSSSWTPVTPAQRGKP